MAIHPDVIELVSILSEEGFDILAGELLSEIGLGREINSLEGEVSVEASYLGERPSRREPVPDGEQLGFAIRLLRLRLVEPTRRLAEAENIAGRIQGEAAAGQTELSTPVRIAFVPLQDGDPPRLDRKVVPGDREDADELARLLSRIAPEVE